MATANPLADLISQGPRKPETQASVDEVDPMKSNALTNLIFDATIIQTSNSPNQNSPAEPSTKDIRAEELRSLLTESAVLTPQSDGYSESIRRVASSAERPARLVLVARSARDISKTITFCQQHALDMAVCGGGHSTSGASSSDGGVLIDLSKMRKVVVDEESMTITAQGGCLWADVDAAANEHGLAAVGGTVNHTGIGGLTLGGGFGWLTGKYGLTIDNLIAVEIVLADGRIVRASEKEETDLFWACRGAGANFGVVTSFIYRAHKHTNTVFAGIMAFPPNSLDALTKVMNIMLETTTGETAALFGFACPPPARKPVPVAAIFHNGSEEDAREAWAPIFRLSPLLDHTHQLPYPSANTIINPLVTPGARKSIKSTCITAPMRPEFIQHLYKQYCSVVTDVPDSIGSVILFDLISRKKASEVPQTAMAYANRGEQISVFADMRWMDIANDTTVRQRGRDLVASCKDETGQSKVGLEGVGMYGNFNHESSAAETFGENLGRLKEVKRRFDPNNLFNKLHPIPITR